MTSATEMVRALILGIRNDVALYQKMEALLKDQCVHMCRRNNEALAEGNREQLQMVRTLHLHARQRVELLKSLKLSPDSDGIDLLASKLPVKAGEMLLSSWSALITAVERCQRQNECNGRLLAHQQQLIRSLLHEQQSFYQPKEGNDGRF